METLLDLWEVPDPIGKIVQDPKADPVQVSEIHLDPKVDRVRVSEILRDHKVDRVRALAIHPDRKEALVLVILRDRWEDLERVNGVEILRAPREAQVQAADILPAHVSNQI